jgi:hypothetical protein
VYGINSNPTRPVHAFLDCIRAPVWWGIVSLGDRIWLTQYRYII